MRLRHSYRINHRLAYVLFTLSLQHYSSIMRRILLVYTLYVGAYFVLFGRRLQSRVYRQFRARGPFLLALQHGAQSAFAWGAWQLLWRWFWLAAVHERGGHSPVGLQVLRAALLERARALGEFGVICRIQILKSTV